MDHNRAIKALFFQTPAGVFLLFFLLCLCSQAQAAQEQRDANPPTQTLLMKPSDAPLKAAPPLMKNLSFAQEERPAPVLSGYKALPNTYNLPAPEKLLDFWSDIQIRHNPDSVFGKNQTYMNDLKRMQWKNISSQMPSMPPDKKLRVINGFFNSWPSRNDQTNYGKKEYWASPEEFFKKGSGDCEDYAIIKYFALRYFSWPAEDLWLVLVTEKKTKMQHAVLMARFGNQRFILDNLSKPPYLLIPEQDYMKRYTPFLALNELGNWIFAYFEKPMNTAAGKETGRKKEKSAVPSPEPSDAPSTILRGRQ